MGRHSVPPDPFDESAPAVLRPGYDSPELRNAAFTDTDYRPWVASLGGLALANLILLFAPGLWLWSALFAAFALVPMLGLPSLISSRRLAVGVARRSAASEGRRPGSVPSERMFTLRELVLAGVVAVLLVAYVAMFVAVIWL